MTTLASAELCRLVVYGPERRVEIAVPVQVLIADLVPALLPHLGDHLPDAGLAHGGWVLQRLGDSPLADDGTVGSLGLTDGSVVHLRPRSGEIPAADFDDLADGLATGMRDRAGLWRPEMARWASAAALTLALAAGLGVLTLPGSAPLRAAIGGVLAVVALVGALALTRAFANRPFGLVVGVSAIGYAGVAATILPTTAGVGVFSGASVFSGAVVATLAAVVAAAVVGWSGPLFAGLIAGLASVAAGGATSMFFGLSAGPGAGVTVVLSTIGCVVVPSLSIRLARIRVDPLPTKPEHLQEDIDPEPSAEVLAGAFAADRYMTGIYVGLAVASLGGSVLVAELGGWAAYTLLGLVGVVRLLIARATNSAWHRAALAVPGLVGVLVAALLMLAATSVLPRLLLLLAALPVLTVVLVALANRLPGGRRMMPLWGRIGDLIQVLATVALVPVLAAMTGLLDFARALGG